MLDSTGLNRYRRTLPHATLRRIETVAGAGCGEAAIRAAGQFDQGLADADDARCFIAHARTLSRTIQIGGLAKRANPFSPFAPRHSPGWCAIGIMLYYNISDRTEPAKR